MSMAGSAQKRISLLFDKPFTPLPTIQDTAVGREQPWEGLLLERHAYRPVEVPEHEHPDFFISLQTSGEAGFEWWSEGKNRIEKRALGSLVVVPPGTRDRMVLYGPSTNLVLSIQQDRLSSMAAELQYSKMPEFKVQWSLKSEGLKQLVLEMGREAEAEWPHGKLYADVLSLGLQKLLLLQHSVEVVSYSEPKGTNHAPAKARPGIHQ